MSQLTEDSHQPAIWPQRRSQVPFLLSLPAGVCDPASCHCASPCQKAGGSIACWWCTLLPRSLAVVSTAFFHTREIGNWRRSEEIKQKSGNMVLNSLSILIYWLRVTSFPTDASLNFPCKFESMWAFWILCCHGTHILSLVKTILFPFCICRKLPWVFWARYVTKIQSFIWFFSSFHPYL